MELYKDQLQLPIDQNFIATIEKWTRGFNRSILQPIFIGKTLVEIFKYKQWTSDQSDRWLSSNKG